jgi:hypothetical protein
MIIKESKPKRALLAYCALVDRLTTPGMGAIQSLMPFFAEVCVQFAGELFDASKFSAAVTARYGIEIPRLAALGFTDQMANEGLLIDVSGHGKRPIYRYENVIALDGAATASPVSEADIDKILTSFAAYCRTDELLAPLEDNVFHTAFLDRLLHIESMRLLARKERSITAKKSASTLVLTKPSEKVSESDSQELHIDYLTSQFLLDLRDTDEPKFELVSNIAFASMAAEAIASFQEPPGKAGDLTGLTIYLDSPLLLDMLGVNEEYAEYGKELLQSIKKSGAHPAVLEHSVIEAESAVYAQLNYLRSGVNQMSYKLGLSAKPDLLGALIGNVGARAEQRLGITVERDPDLNLHRRAATTVGDIEGEMNKRMQAWRNEEAKDHDRKSVWSMLAIRDTTSVCPRICDSKFLLIARNTPLVSIANYAWTRWLKDTTKHSSIHLDKWAPISLSDKQFAGYVWARSGSDGTKMPRARLLAHCSAAVRPRADVKAKAYNLVLELNGKEEADDVAALLEDREGARALMRATKGDPEDVTAGRLPYILESVKLAAGEFAAARVREESERERQKVEAAHAMTAQLMAAELAEAEELRERESQAARIEIQRAAEDRKNLVDKNEALIKAIELQAASEYARTTDILEAGLLAGAKLYRYLRWSVAALFGIAAGAAAYLSAASPIASTSLTILVSIGGFWFVPDLLHGPINRFAMIGLRKAIRAKDSALPIPIQQPDFKNTVWVTNDSSLLPMTRRIESHDQSRS